jgi:hypothetical protein
MNIASWARIMTKLSLKNGIISYSMTNHELQERDFAARALHLYSGNTVRGLWDLQ